ncbi:MAG: hypothetical protein JW795_22465 [Chitinivibrionales bacterium]|nr:hypothetical protein [Chitinivibrionales bacterium]
MVLSYEILKEEKNFYTIIALKILRQTQGVIFDIIPVAAIESIDAIDRVIHSGGAFSPGSVAGVQRPWYMHQHQHDHLVVFAGTRTIDLYSAEYKKIVNFTISAQNIYVDGKLFSDQPVMLAWSPHVFHRIISDPKLGSSSINIASRYPGFDIKTNFSIYSLDTTTGSSEVIRQGHLDQPGDH